MAAVNFRKLPTGARVGPYTIDKLVGTGAFASVYTGVLPDGSVRALKVRRAGEASHDRRFLREFESMRALRIPGVVRVHDAGQDADLLWFAMDYVDGLHFDEVVQRLPTPRARARLAARLGHQVLLTLTRLHQSGIIHRDVKPSNILVDSQDRVHVLDFGIVRFFGEVPGQQTTSSGEVIGTVPFMAPEQLAGLPIDEKIDVFACGILLYEAVSGRRKRPKNPLAWIPRTCLERPVPLASRYREVSRGLSHALEEMLSVDPAARPSAATAAKALRNENAGMTSTNWPAAPFVVPGDWFEDLLGCIGDTRSAHVQAISGPAGSGRRRLAEQVQREGLVQGVWTVHTRCRRDESGGPVGTLVERIVRSVRDERLVREVFGSNADPLRRMWPHAGIPGDPEPGAPPTAEDVGRALAHSLATLARGRPTLWIVHNVEDVDPLTAVVLARATEQASARLGFLLTVDPRWASPRSQKLLAGLPGLATHTVDTIDGETADAIARGLAPEAPTPPLTRCRAQYAVERGIASLAAWRDEPFAPPASRLWPLAILERPIPSEVLRRLSGASAAADPHVVEERGEVHLAGEVATTAVRARLTDREQASRALLKAWRVTADVPAPATAALRLLANQPERAYRPMALSAIEAAHLGRYADARRALMALDVLPVPDDLPAAAAYPIARVRARTLLRTEATSPRAELCNAASASATSNSDELDARLIRAEYLLREGKPDNSVVAALRVAAAASRVAPAVAVRALLVATQSRAALGRLEEAVGELDRAEAILRKHPDAVLAVQAQSWRAELALHDQDLAKARDLSVQALRDANTFGYVRGGAFNAARLGHVLRMAGRRREAETHIRDALDAFAVTGDVALYAQARLLLATLVAERGDAAAARYMVDEALRRIQQLRLDRLVPVGLRVALLTATHVGASDDAAMALEALSDRVAEDAEAPAAIARWWRSRGDTDRASDVPPPSQPGYGRVAWELEQARTALSAGDPDRALLLASSARAAAVDAGFRELGLYGTLLMGGLGRLPEDWPDRLARAAQSLNLDIYLGAIEMEARRLHAEGQFGAARDVWRNLALRSNDFGFVPGITEANGWIVPTTA